LVFSFIFIFEKAGKTIFLKKAAKKTRFFAIKVDFQRFLKNCFLQLVE
jgi:hypothetical protein